MRPLRPKPSWYDSRVLCAQVPALPAVMMILFRVESINLMSYEDN